MPSRNKHTKSRHGCSQCKAAHVKCDLAHPICGKCTKSRKNCHFTNLVNVSHSNTHPTVHSQNYPTYPTMLSSTGPQDMTTPTPETSSIPIPSLGIVSWHELELLHHFSTITYVTMAAREDIRRMWQINVPKMALKHDFLMHSLFSVTALHIASSCPDNQSSYIDRAIRHHNIALREYSAELKSITRENSAALFTCATLTVISALSLVMLRPNEEQKGLSEGLLGIFMLLRGVPLVLHATWIWIEKSEIAPLLIGREKDESIVLSDEVTNAIKLLEDRNQWMSSSDADRNTYARAIQGLKECFNLLSSKDRDNGMVLTWPISLSPEYLELLGSCQQMAVVILAHYAVILNEIRDTWWEMGWGRKLIQEIHQLVHDEWKVLVAWPMDKIGMGRNMTGAASPK